MTTVRFEQVTLKGTKRWTDAEGRKRQETRTFMQTINPFNKNAAGFVKNRREIEQELLTERKEWLCEESLEKK
jgi:hypothetical protein